MLYMQLVQNIKVNKSFAEKARKAMNRDKLRELNVFPKSCHTRQKTNDTEVLLQNKLYLLNQTKE